MSLNRNKLLYKLSCYLRIDLSLRYDFKIQSGLYGSLSLSFWNLRNRTNLIDRFYSLDSSDLIIERNLRVA